MIYIPKNRIISNLFSNNNEFVFKGTSKVYLGSYWKTYDGKYFTGKNPNDLPSEELEKLVNVEETFEADVPTSKIAFIDSPFPNIDENLYNEGMIIEYANLKGDKLNPSEPKKIPQQYFPNPVQEDYDLGTFTRYFLVKSNQNIYTEVIKKTYDYITKKDLEWLWEMYIPFSIQWALEGEEKEVYLTNRNIVLLQEQRLKRRGFQEFLKKNYTKFWRPE